MNNCRHRGLSLVPLAALAAAVAPPALAQNAPQSVALSRDSAAPLVERVRAAAARYRDINVAKAVGA